MSQILINDYLKQLDLIKKISGSNRETIVREAFKDLLKNWGKQEKLVFLAEYPQKTASKKISCRRRTAARTADATGLLGSEGCGRQTRQRD